MDAAVFIERPNDNNKVVNGHRWRIFRLLFNINWTSCLIGLATGCIVTVYMTLALMLIILPYIQGSCSYKGNHIWSSYGEWEWEPCSVTCGNGLQMGQRSRKCISDIVCTGNETETMTRQCTSEHCKVDGQWSNWNAHGTCSVTCGVGILQQYRECTNPSPENGGKSCDGERLRQITCNTKSRTIGCAVKEVGSNKLTGQSSDFFGFPNSKNAVDGNFSTMSHTGNENQPYWWVDLGRTYQVERVEIYNRKDCCGERLRDLDIKVGPTLDNLCLCSHFDGPGQNGEHVIINCSEKIGGRYVKLVKQRAEWLHMLEVRVYGCEIN